MAFSRGPFEFTDEGVLSVAGVEGVYGIVDTQGKAIYVGEAEDTHVRLREHVTGKSKESGCIWDHGPHRYFIEPVLGGKDPRLAVEGQLISQLEPYCNQT